MVILQARPVLLVATIVWVLWRALLWRRRTSTNVAREVVVAATFLWSLVIVKLTFFPLTIIFYDWHGSSNLIPFASIAQLVRETPPVFAFENIVGNLLLFAPLGVLLPLLFNRLERPSALLWRAGAISLLIEGTQFITRARAVDIDDVILNTTGAMIGLGFYAVGASLVKRAPEDRRLHARLASGVPGEPLLAAAVPFLITAAITIPMMMSTIVGQTLGDGPDGIEATALAALTSSDVSDAQVVARSDIEGHTFILVATDGSAGNELSRSEFKKVFPGRYTWIGTGGTNSDGPGSNYQSSITSFNPSAGEQPLVVAWGSNADKATSVHITGNGVNTVLPLEPGSHFVVGTEFEYDETVGILDEFEFAFMTDDGTVPGFSRVGQ